MAPNLDLDGNIATEEKETTLRRKISDQAKELLVKWVTESQGNPNYIFDCCWCHGGTYEGDITPYHHDWCPYGFIKSLAIA